jgi:hypothetical protein
MTTCMKNGANAWQGHRIIKETRGLCLLHYFFAHCIVQTRSDRQTPPFHEDCLLCYVLCSWVFVVQQCNRLHVESLVLLPKMVIAKHLWCALCSPPLPHPSPPIQAKYAPDLAISILSEHSPWRQQPGTLTNGCSNIREFYVHKERRIHAFKDRSIRRCLKSWSK